MERFEIIIRAEGHSAVWIALFTIAILSIVAVISVYLFCRGRGHRGQRPAMPTPSAKE